MSLTYVKHPWNADFAWRSPQPPYRALAAEQAMQFDRDGYVVLDDVFGADTLEQVRSEVDRFDAEAEAALRRRPDQRAAIAEAGAITFVPNLVARSAVLRSFVTHPTLLGLCADLVGPDVNLYWEQAVYKRPEKPRRFPWHQDNGYTYIEPQQYLTCWVALNDATIENGCPHVVPGLHRSGTLQHHFVEPLGWECFEDPGDSVAAPVRAGGVVVFSSLTPHMTGPNVSDGVRKAYIIQYAPADARVQLGVPDAGPPTGEQGCDDADRQFPVLRAGEPVNPNRG